MRRITALLPSALSTIAALALVVSPKAFAFTVPANDGFVTDTAQVLSEAQERQLESVLDAYEKETSNEVAVFITQNLNDEPISDVGVEVFREWGIGKEENDNGILILLAYEDREVNITTGYGLEGAVPDIVAKGIIDRDMIPEFREGRYYEGLLAGIDALKKHIGGEYTAERYSMPDIDIGGIGLFLLFLFLNFGISILGRTRSWWLGGVLGAVFGLVLAALYGWWISIPLLVVLGLILDFFISRLPRSMTRWRGGRGGRGGWGGGFGGGGGGFGGFGGGSTGGGGARGRW